MFGIHNILLSIEIMEKIKHLVLMIKLIVSITKKKMNKLGSVYFRISSCSKKLNSNYKKNNKKLKRGKKQNWKIMMLWREINKG